MSLDSAHKEKAFENDIVQGFVDQKWLSSPNDKGYDPYKVENAGHFLHRNVVGKVFRCNF